MCVLAHDYQPSGGMCWLMFRVVQNTDNNPQHFVASQPRRPQTVHVLQLKFPSKHVSQRCSAFSVNWNRTANLPMSTGNHYPVHTYTVVETTAIKMEVDGCEQSASYSTHSSCLKCDHEAKETNTCLFLQLSPHSPSLYWLTYHKLQNILCSYEEVWENVFLTLASSSHSGKLAKSLSFTTKT